MVDTIMLVSVLIKSKPHLTKDRLAWNTNNCWCLFSLFQMINEFFHAHVDWIQTVEMALSHYISIKGRSSSNRTYPHLIQSCLFCWVILLLWQIQYAGAQGKINLWCYLPNESKLGQNLFFFPNHFYLFFSFNALFKLYFSKNQTL